MCKICRLCCFSVLPKYKQNVIEIFPPADVQPDTVSIDTAAPSDKVMDLLPCITAFVARHVC
jgi:hypothetical protein